MDLYRINVKFFLEIWTVSPDDTFRTFNGWISNSSDEVLIDVADYSHIHAGPVTLLVGHEANYSIDNANDKPGLLYARKRPMEGDLPTRLKCVFAAALKACHRLERDPDLKGKVKFRGEEFSLTTVDRLRVPSTAEIQTSLGIVLEKLYGGAGSAVEYTADSIARPTFQVKAISSFTVSGLLHNLEA
jgi:hypothetical protein